MTALAELRDVHKSFEAAGAADGPQVLKGIDLEIREGSSLAIVGRSGSGKSTLLYILGALETATRGDVRAFGQDLAGLDASARARMRNEEIGFVFQSHHLLPQLTALENVLVPTLVGPKLSDAAARARALLERVGLADRMGHRPGQLSGGECQRVAVARALVREPKLLLADEPTGSLDRASADQVADLLQELHEKDGRTIVLVTHSPELASRMSTVRELRDGRLASADA